MNLIITNEFNKMDILKKITNEKKFNNYKFYSFNELKRKLFFDYDNKTIEYVMKKYNVNLSIAKIYIENLPNLNNETEAVAEFAHKIQEETKGASVLLYPDAAITAYINFPQTKEYYEYNTVVFKPSKSKGLNKFGYAKRFKSSELGGQENARKAAIDFAEKNTKKYMEMIDKMGNSMY